MHPELIDLGFWAVPTYGVVLAVAVVVGLWTLKLRADQAEMDGTKIVDLTLWIVIWALVGSKLLMVLLDLPRYLRHPADLVGTLRAGGVFLGGFIAALVTAVILVRRYALPALATLDVIVPSLALGHAIGRIGCLMAGCCWGRACELPWAIRYTDSRAAELLGTPLYQPVHPSPVYESVFNFGLYLVLAALYRRLPPAGRVFAAYLVLYGIGRFLLEYLRGDADRGFVFGGALSTSQLIAALMVPAGAGLALWATRRRS